MKCPKCSFEQADGAVECLKCGIYFTKYKKAMQRRGRQAQPIEVGLLWQMPEASDQLYRFFRFLLLLWFIWMSWSLIASPISWQLNAALNSFIHVINMPFHEFGHKLFAFLGRFMGSLGGSLAQLLMPLICLYVLLIKTRDAFGAAACLWWFGENFLDMASYIDDARNLSAPLLGGNFGHSSPYGFHDWEFILTEMGMIHLNHTLAKASHIWGSMLMISAMLWMLLLLLRKCEK